MKNLLMLALVGAIFYSCGEEGVGFNARKEVSVETPFTIPGPPSSYIGNLVDYDPEEEVEDISFDLGDVSESVDDLGELVLNSISYELQDISSLEEVDLDRLQVIIELPGANDLILLDLTGRLENSAKETIELTTSQRASLEDQLFSRKQLDGRVVIDLAELPNEDGVELTFISYFDATVKIRDL